MNNAFDSTIHDARFPKSAGTEKIEQDKFVRPVSTILRSITKRDGDLSSNFDRIVEIENAINITPLKQTLFNDHTGGSRGLIRGYLPIEHNFGSCKSFKEITKEHGSELELRTPNRKQAFLYTTREDNTVDVTINSGNRFIPTTIPSPETQSFCNEATTKALHFHMNPGEQIESPSRQLENFKQILAQHQTINLHCI